MDGGCLDASVANLTTFVTKGYFGSRFYKDLNNWMLKNIRNVDTLFCQIDCYFWSKECQWVILGYTYFKMPILNVLLLKISQNWLQKNQWINSLQGQNVGNTAAASLVKSISPFAFLVFQ